ncbi:MAG TPA: hypothetical protein VFW64_22690 [Pseudonocardiaceae bacterium]|nr:hypothetical protein [Pseudonocardiaceae bacterium]
MAEQLEPEDQPDDAAKPVPNRRERRGGKSAAPATQSGKSGVGRRSGPVAPSRQYSTRRRSG